METRKQGNSERYQGGYQGYGSMEETQPAEQSKAVERDMSLLEYDLDKDYIIEELNETRMEVYDSADSKKEIIVFKKK